MTTQLNIRPAIRLSRERDSARPRSRVFGPVMLLSAIVMAGVAGVGVAAYVTDPVAPTRVVYQQPNASDRESRTLEIPAPNANAREGRVPTTTAVGPNANAREGRTSNNR
jgi:hypothetical protein